jgi:hypothetical protein
MRQIFELKATGPGGQRLWAYRYELADAIPPPPVTCARTAPPPTTAPRCSPTTTPTGTAPGVVRCGRRDGFAGQEA